MIKYKNAQAMFFKYSIKLSPKQKANSQTVPKCAAGYATPRCCFVCLQPMMCAAFLPCLHFYCVKLHIDIIN